MIGLAIGKEVLRHRGAVRLARTRHPGLAVDPVSAAKLADLFDRLGLLPADAATSENKATT